jgi:hypothetical protein
MVSGERGRIAPGIGDKNVRPAVSIEIGDKDLTRLNGSGYLTGDYFCGTVDVTASGLTKSDDDGQPLRGLAKRRKDNVRNPVTIEVWVTAPNTRVERIPNRRQYGNIVE